MRKGWILALLLLPALLVPVRALTGEDLVGLIEVWSKTAGRRSTARAWMRGWKPCWTRAPGS